MRQATLARSCEKPLLLPDSVNLLPSEFLFDIFWQSISSHIVLAKCEKVKTFAVACKAARRRTMISRILIGACAAIVVFLGSVHLAYTFFYPQVQPY